MVVIAGGYQPGWGTGVSGNSRRDGYIGYGWNGEGGDLQLRRGGQHRNLLPLGTEHSDPIDPDPVWNSNTRL